ncbi:hypothetical protein MY5147_001703 [Beauveria neobassiana]
MRLARLQPFRCAQLRPLRPLLRPSWICASCRPNGPLPRRWNSSAQTKEKPFYVTTPIFYVNAAPHIGHLYCTVLADVLKRWQQINGKDAYLCTGTDEHGMKIQRAAAKEGMDPKSFCDLNSDKFRSLTHDADISNDFFVRTTDPDHKDAVSQFWLQLKNSLPKDLGLYKGTHEGWYCVSDECFYPEDLVQPSIVPQTGKKIMINVESENEVEWVKEETWFFPLTKYKDALLKFYDENPDWVRPANRMQEVRDWVENHLEDLSVTRPVSRLNWGIADPEDPTQTIYVWVDALINYITKAGYGSQWRTPTDDMGIWPADLHIIGKDILRFHAIYWPALLLALGLPPAKGILCHNHWTMSNRKMSKSLGNVVSPVFALQRWDVDPLRYFLMRNGNLTKDMSYSNDIISAIYGKELQANIGNLFYRIAKPKGAAGWSTRKAVASSNSGAFKELDEVRHKAEYAQFFSLESTLRQASDAFSKEMEDYNTGGAIREAFELLRDTNRYITDTQPWVLAKQKEPLSKLLLNWTIHRSAEALRIAAILLQPIMPSKMKRLLDEMGVRPDRRSVAYAHPDADDAYGTRNQGNSNHDRANKHLLLFPPMASGDVSDAEVLQQLKAYMGKNMAKSKMNQMVELLAMEARMGEAQVAKLLGTEFPVEQTPPRHPNRAIVLTHYPAIAAARALLVPYEAHHVVKYHGWMQDPDIQEATASEPMTLEEEYENQQSWRTSADKLTFIICEPVTATQTTITAQKQDANPRMIGDVNFFLYPDDGDDNENATGDALVGEVDVMIAAKEHRGQGYGEAAVRALLVYIQTHLDAILAEYAQGGPKSSLRALMVKIQQGNKGSRALFEKLGFMQMGDVNYFGEVKMVLDWRDEVGSRDDAWKAAAKEYRELKYEALL